MLTVAVSDVRNRIYGMIKKVIDCHEPIVITGENGNVIMISEEDYKAMQETIYLLGVPGMHESIIKGSKESIECCSEVDEHNWSSSVKISQSKNVKIDYK